MNDDEFLVYKVNDFKPLEKKEKISFKKGEKVVNMEEYKNIKEWIKNQQEKNPGIGGAAGGRFTYKFTPTGLGTVGTIIDGFTGDEFTFKELG